MSVYSHGPLFGPISDVQGFSMRDGKTHLEIQEHMRKTILDLVATVNNQNNVLRTAISSLDGALDGARGAMDLLRPPVNVTDFGVFNDGAHGDQSSAIQSVIDAHPEGVYIPSGIYPMAHTLVVAYDLPQPFRMELAAGAHMIAIAEMDDMIHFGVNDAGTGVREMYALSGGHWDGAGLANCAIHISGVHSGFMISDIDLEEFVTYGIRMDRPPSGSHDNQLSNIRINKVRDSYETITTYGIYAEGNDWQLSNLYAARCGTFIYSAGTVQVNNIHLFNSAATTGDIGIRCTGLLLGTDLYFDTIDTCITFASLDGTFSTSRTANRAVLANLFYYEYTSKSSSIIIEMRNDDALIASNVVIQFNGGTVKRKILSLRTAAGGYTTSCPRAFLSNVRSATSPTLGSGDLLNPSRSHPTNIVVTNDSVNHTQNMGVRIGYIPYDPGASLRGQTVMFVTRETGRTSRIDFHVTYEDGIPVTIMEPKAVVRVVDGVASPVVSHGVLVTKSLRELYLGVKGTPEIVDGINYFPLYLYNDDINMGYIPIIEAEVTGSIAGIAFTSSGATWEIVDPASFVVTTK